MRRLTQLATTGVLLLALSALARAEGEEASRPEATAARSDSAAIVSFVESWLDAYERGDARAVADLFTEDGIYAANTGQLLRGREAVRQGVRGWIDRRPAMFAAFRLDPATELDVRAEAVRIRVEGEVAYALNRFTIWASPGDCMVDAGHALAVLRREADGGHGGWLLESQVVNQDRGDPPPEACARRAREGS